MPNGVIIYTDEKDRPAVNLIAAKTGFSIYPTDSPSPDVSYAEFVIVGGQEATPMFNWFTWEYHFLSQVEDLYRYLNSATGSTAKSSYSTVESRFKKWELDALPGLTDTDREIDEHDFGFQRIKPEDAGYIYIQKVDPYYIDKDVPVTVYGVAGWNAADTLHSAEYIRDNGLPGATVKIPYAYVPPPVIPPVVPPSVTLESLRAEADLTRSAALPLISTYGFPEVFNNISWMNTFKNKVIAAGFQLYEDWTVGTKAPPVPPEPDVPWFINLLNTSFSLALTAFLPLTQAIKNTIIAGVLATTAGKNLLENWARYLANKFTDEYPEYAILKDIPEASITVLAILGIIGTFLGTGFIYGWLKKELPEPAGMAVWAAIDEKQWETANDANAKYIKFINAVDTKLLRTLIWLNPFTASYFNVMRDSQLAQAATFQAVIDTNLVIKSTLNISSIPTGAKIYVDTAYTFESTNTSITVEPGHHTITLKKTDYNDASQEIDIAAGETKYISMTLTSAVAPPVPPPIPPPEVPGEEVVIPLVPTAVVYNAWKVTIKAIDAATNEPLGAAILINDEFMDNYTPWWYYFAPESTYNIKLRKTGYKQGEVTYTTPALPEA